MATGLFAVARGVAGTLGVALSASVVEYRRAVHAVWLADEQGLRDLPTQWVTTELQQFFVAEGDPGSVAQVRGAAHLHALLHEEATIAAYQDVFLYSALLSLAAILPALLRTAARRAPAGRAVPPPEGQVSRGEHAGRDRLP